MDFMLSEKINDLYKANELMKDFNGYILIRKGVDIIFEQSFGVADHVDAKKHDRDTVFCLGSITKQFTAMCVLILDQLGLLSIDDYIGKYLSDFEKGSSIKIRDMLNMISGIPEYWCHPEWKEFDGVTLENICSFIKGLADYNPTRKQFHYCNSNYMLLGALIEKVSGIKYEEFLQKYIFDPLDMKRSGYLPYNPAIDNVAAGYQCPRLGPLVKRKLMLSSFSAGNIYSSAADLCKWDDALYTEQLVISGRLKQMFTPVLGDYGMGWFIHGDKLSHGGDLPGFSTRISRWPEKRLLVLMLCNVEGCKDSNMCHYADLIEKCIFSY